MLQKKYREALTAYLQADDGLIADKTAEIGEIGGPAAGAAVGCPILQ